MLGTLMRAARNRFALFSVAVVTAVGLAVPASAALLAEGRDGELPEPLADLCANAEDITEIPLRLIPVSIESTDCDLRGLVVSAGSLRLHVPQEEHVGATTSSVFTRAAPDNAVTTISALNTGTEVLVRMVRADGTRLIRGVPFDQDAGPVGTERGSALPAPFGQAPQPGPRKEACSAEAYRYTGARTETLDWYLNAASVPDYLPAQTAELGLIDGVEAITTGANDCGLEPLDDTGHTYHGDTSRRADCTGPDGQSTIDFGPRPEETLATACWWYSTVDGVNRNFEADIRFQDRSRRFYYFEPEACSEQYELSGIAAHEFGHVYGLAHVSEKDYPDQTMSAIAPKCSYAQSSLGRGDWQGLRHLHTP